MKGGLLLVLKSVRHYALSGCLAAAVLLGGTDELVGQEISSGGSIVIADLEQVRAAAAAGDSGAQFKLGDYFFGGQRMEEAVHWYRMAAEAGNVQAQISLARCYLKGTGVEKDLERAAHWANRAAQVRHRPEEGELEDNASGRRDAACAAGADGDKDGDGDADGEGNGNGNGDMGDRMDERIVALVERLDGVCMNVHDIDRMDCELEGVELRTLRGYTFEQLGSAIED